MCSSEDAKRFAQDRIQWVLEHQCRIPIRKNTPITFYYKTSDNLIDEADYHYKTHQYEESFILYSRYITLFVEELKKYHPHFVDAPVNERERVKEIIRSKAFPRAEELKAKLKEKYAREYEEKQKLVHEDMIRIPSPIPMNNLQENSPNVPGTQPSPLQNHPIENYHIEAAAKDHPHGKQYSSLIKLNRIHLDVSRPIFDRFQKSTFIKTSLNSFRPMSIPKDIKSKFLQVAQNNTNKSIETCGILAGKRNEKNQYVLTHIVLPKQNGGPDSCDTEKEEEMLEYISTHDLITLGWIHTHPSQTVFLSSVDLHTHLSYQMLMQEAVAIVISPKYDEIGIFSLTPETGIPTISTCQKSGFHEHMNNPPLYTVSTHATYDSNLQCQIVDLRQ